MGFIGNIFSAAIKTALTPVAVIKDAANVLTGEQANTTKDLLKSVSNDISDATDDLCDGEL